MDENARKRKRELDGDDSSDMDVDIEKEKPGEGLKSASGATKKQKVAKQADAEGVADEEGNADGQEHTKQARTKLTADEKRRRKLEKKEKRKEKAKQKNTSKKEGQGEVHKAQTEAEESDDEKSDEDQNEEEPDHDDDHIQALDVSGLVEEGQSTATPTSTNSNASTASVISAASSSSSILPPSDERAPEKKEKKPLKLDPKSHDTFRARLTAKLEAMRAARKADGPDGRPARNRAELIEMRRRKEAERKAARKASRQLAKEDEERLKAEEQLARIRGGSGSPSMFSKRSSPDHERNFSFGRVAWDDGKQLEGDLSGFLESRKKKGRSDPKTALEAAKNKKARLNALDEAKRKDIEEKDLWLNAKKRAQGERVHDDPKLLKKSVKRIEKAKAKSRTEWKDRLINVQKGKEVKQKRREENLRKRKEEKGSKGKKAKKPGKKVKRPGFEGTFKAR